MSETTADLTRYLPPDTRSWIPACAERVGWDELKAYYDRVFLLLAGMRPMDEFDIVKSVAPERYGLFLSCVVTAIAEATRYTGNNYHIENKATLVICR